MKNFKNYIFDLGAVIADINVQNALDGFRVLGVPEEELRYDIGETAKIMQNYQLGLLSTDKFCDAIISRCKVGATNPKNNDAPSPLPSRQQVANAWNTTILHISQCKLDALRTLKQKANVYLLSNTNELHWQKCLDNWFNKGNGIFGINNIKEIFHHIFLSQEMHLEKPNPEIFKKTLRYIAEEQSHEVSSKALPLDASNTVFLDDNLANVEAARSCGISGIHVTPDYDWVAELL